MELHRRQLIGLRVSVPMDLHDRDCGVLVGGGNYMKDDLVERPQPYALSAEPQAASTRVAIKSKLEISFVSFPIHIHNPKP